MPWSQFQSARLEDKKVELSFGAVLVIVAGENLLGLKEAIAAYRVSLLREVPPEYRQKAAVGEPFVVGIEVRPAEG